MCGVSLTPSWGGGRAAVAHGAAVPATTCKRCRSLFRVSCVTGRSLGVFFRQLFRNVKIACWSPQYRHGGSGSGPLPFCLSQSAFLMSGFQVGSPWWSCWGWQGSMARSNLPCAGDSVYCVGELPGVTSHNKCKGISRAYPHKWSFWVRGSACTFDKLRPDCRSPQPPQPVSSSRLLRPE